MLDRFLKRNLIFRLWSITVELNPQTIASLIFVPVPGFSEQWLFLGLKARNVIARAVANAASEGLGKDSLVPGPVSGGNHLLIRPGFADPATKC